MQGIKTLTDYSKQFTQKLFKFLPKTDICQTNILKI